MLNLRHAVCLQFSEFPKYRVMHDLRRLSVLGDDWRRGGLFRPLLGGGVVRISSHITVITTILRHTAETSIGCSIAYMCCSDWWQCLKRGLIWSSFVCNDARTLGLFQYICVIKEYSSFPVCWSSISSHIYVPTYLNVRLAALWDVWVRTSVVCLLIHYYLIYALVLYINIAA